MTQERAATAFAMMSGGAAASTTLETIHTVMQIGAGAISIIAGALTIVMWVRKYLKERAERVDQ